MSPPYGPMSTIMKVDSLDSWDPPMEGVFKLNFYRVSKGNPGNVGFGGAI